ncbi:MAG: signal peptidase I [Candidatus Sumerlaeota bacterium]|nr:signal peptidase I [Candidatus Sumerlaeota bacterium]
MSLENASGQEASDSLAKYRGANASPQRGIFTILREWIDPLIFAYLLAMFIRTFFVELFKIPSGSMTPTLVGDTVAEMDYNHDGKQDLIVANYSNVANGGPVRYQFFPGTDTGYDQSEPTSFSYHLTPDLMNEFESKKAVRYDRICVNKFANWLKPVQRGDIMVFKVPRINEFTGRELFSREKPIYVKRVAGLPGETVEIRDNRLWINGQRVTEPAFFADHYYENECAGAVFTKRTLKKDEYLMFGDNTRSSLDSRNWGPVSFGNFRGKAFFRYAPVSKMKFLR